MTGSILERAAQFIRSSVATESEGGQWQAVQLVDALERRAHGKEKLRRLAVGGVCTIGAVGVILVVSATARIPRSHDLTYRVGSSTELGVVGSYVSATTAKPLDLHFSEGSQVVLQPQARVRVAGTTSHGATMILEDGHARADIVHRAGTDWRILAGPYVVGITGTSFEVSYDVTTQTFEVDMHSGAVKVSGPGLAAPVEIRDSQRFVLSASSAASSNAPSAVAPSVPSESNVDSTSQAKVDEAPTEASGETSMGHARESGASPHVASAPGSASALVANSWSQLGARGQHRQIVALAEQLGLDIPTANVSAADLLALGNAARFSGKPELAGKAYRALRRRFSGSAEAIVAAFFLGRLSESSDPAKAIGWYEQYAAEAPTGAWVADALGRRMVILNDTKGLVSTQSAAKDYLERFPKGPYAGYARKIIGP